MTLHHTHDPICPLCEDKKKDAHPLLRVWFDTVKAKHPEAHIAWSYRDRANQEEACREGKSKLHYPRSGHNQTSGEKPCAIAMDLFELTPDNKARFSQPWYEKIWQTTLENKAPVFWGAIWKTLGDNDHFQIKSEVLAPHTSA